MARYVVSWGSLFARIILGASLKNEQLSDISHLNRPQAWANGREITGRGETPHEHPPGSGRWSRHRRAAAWVGPL